MKHDAIGEHTESLLTASCKAPHMSPYFCFAPATFQKLYSIYKMSASSFSFRLKKKKGTYLQRFLFPPFSSRVLHDKVFLKK